MSHLIRQTSNASLSSSNSPRRAVAVAWYTWCTKYNWYTVYSLYLYLGPRVGVGEGSQPKTKAKGWIWQFRIWDVQPLVWVQCSPCWTLTPCPWPPPPPPSSPRPPSPPCPPPHSPSAHHHLPQPVQPIKDKLIHKIWNIFGKIFLNINLVEYRIFMF